MSRTTSRHYQRMRHLSERGDTIVEVMISLVVISSVLTGAFMLSRTSGRNVRSSQEHSEALQLLQGQVESLRAYVTDGGNSPSSLPGTTFCFEDGTMTIHQPAPDPSCTGANDVNNLYNLSITKGTTDGVNGGTSFTFSVDWDALGGGKNHESIVYRINPS